MPLIPQISIIKRDPESASTNQYALGTGTTISMLDVRRTATINKLIHKPKVRSGASGATPKPLQASSIVSIIKK